MVEKTIAHYLSDLRLDLKDSGTLWSDAELTRCVERAVADLSRFLPDEKFLELVIDAEVTGESFTTPAASDTDYFVTTMDISASVDGALCTLAKRKPDVPRPVTITVTDGDSSITQLIIIVKGQDSDNRYMEEYFYLEGGLVQTGKKCFALVTNIEIDEITGNGAADTLIAGTGSNVGVFVQLANKPIKFQSETITGYTRNTDYEMDYASGRIAMKTGGTMVVATAYTVAYTKSRIDIDLTKYITDLIRVDRIEYPIGNVPQNFSKAELWGKILTLTGDYSTQVEASDEEQLVIRYLTSHSPPSSQSPGSFPSFLNTTVQLAASAYALFVYVLKQEHQAAADLVSARTALGNIVALHAAVSSALGKIATYVKDIDTALSSARASFVDASNALAKVNSDGGRTYLTDADGALDDADSAIDKVITYLENNTNEDAKYWLTKITTDIISLRTAIQAALSAATTNLGFALSNNIGAEDLLNTGDDYIDAVNKGARVPENYREFSQVRAEIATTRTAAANSYLQEAAIRLANLNSYITQAIGGWAEVAKGFATEAAQRTNEALARLSIADRRIAEGMQQSAVGQGYVAEAERRYAMCRAVIEEAEQRLAEISGYLSEASRFNELALSEQALADKFRVEGVERRNEAWAIWSSPNQLVANYTLGARAQPP